MDELITCCGNCRYHRSDGNGDWICSNPDSEYFTDWTDYMDWCLEYEEGSE